MPRLSEPRTELIAELGEQLRFGSHRALLRQLAQIDELAVQLDDESLYPEEWIVFRVTGYRPEESGGRLIPGAALRGDLSALSEHLSEAAGLTREEVGSCETVASLCERWGVTRRTLERYRRLGLIARRVDLGQGHRALVFAPEAVARFEQRYAERLGRASGFGRMGEAELERILRWARRYRKSLGWSLHRVAQRISERTGRSVQGVRQVLRRHDDSGDEPIFPDHRPPTDRERLVAIRAVRRGIEPELIAKRTGRHKSAVLRSVRDGRADLLRSLRLERGAHTDVDPSGIAGTGFFTRGPSDLAGLIAQLRERVVSVAIEERARARAFRSHCAGAGSLIEALPPTGVSGSDLDEIQTRLRWAALLKVELLRPQLRSVIDTLEGRLGGPVDELPPVRASSLLISMIGVAGDAIERFDPDRGGRAAAPVTIALGRAASRIADVVPPSDPARAVRRVLAGFDVPDWTARVCAWQQWLAPDPRFARVLGQLDEGDRVMLERRFGLDGRAPETLRSVAESQGLKAMHLAKAERRAVRTALEVARALHTEAGS